jgi:hypothetical protein
MWGISLYQDYQDAHKEDRKKEQEKKEKLAEEEQQKKEDAYFVAHESDCVEIHQLDSNSYQLIDPRFIVPDTCTFCLASNATDTLKTLQHKGTLLGNFGKQGFVLTRASIDTTLAFDTIREASSYIVYSEGEPNPLVVPFFHLH